MKMNMNVHQYSAVIQQLFNESFPGYEVITTYAGDFAIAEWYSTNDVKETAENAWTNWHKDYKWSTEIIMVLNWLCWHHYNQGNEELSKVYAELYYEYKDKFYTEYENNEEANNYFFEMTD